MCFAWLSQLASVLHLSGKRCKVLSCFRKFKLSTFLAVVLLLLFSHVLCGSCSDFKMVSVPLGFEINGFERTKNWVSGNGVFAFGFLERHGDDVDGFVVGIRYNLLGDNVDANVPVWSVGGGVRVSENSTFRLAMDGRLVLVENLSGVIVWSSNTSALGVQKASLLDNGNLVLLGAEGETLWQSFISPTHTLLPGQSLHYPQNLRAPSRKSISSYYDLVIHRSGELALIWEHNVTYWRSHFCSPAAIKEARFTSDGVLGLYDDAGKVVWSVSSKDIGDSSVTLRHLRIDQDGNLRIYSWDDVVHTWKAGWQAVDNQCDVFGSCGLYSYCGYNSTGLVCNCLYSGTSEWENGTSVMNSGGLGCKKMVDLGNCRMRTSMFVMKQTVLYGLYPPHDVDILLSEEDCKDYCANDTTCIAVTSKNDGSGLCTIKRTSYISGYTTPAVPSVSFLKVCLVPQAVIARGANPHGDEESFPSSSGGLAATGGSVKRFIGAILLVVLITALAVLSIEVFVFWIIYHRRQMMAQTRIPFGKDEKMNPHYSALIRLSSEEIKELTNDFADQLGPSIFKGVLPSNAPIIVKVLNDVVVSDKEFRKAVSTLGGMHHRNLVPLKGFCYELKDKFLLYDYVPNGSLDKWLFNPNQNQSNWDWQQRFNIALGVARAIAYMHSECRQCITHGNLKLENVLLDENLVPKVTDFGLKDLTESQAASCSGSPSERDIYVLGEILLKIVTRKREVIGDDLQQIIDNLQEEQKCAVRDDFAAVERVVRIALWCMQNQPHMRPAISEVVKVLEGAFSVDKPPSGFPFKEESNICSETTEIEVE